MGTISRYYMPFQQEVIADFLFHICKFLQSRRPQYDFKAAPEVALKNRDLKDGYIIPDVSVKKWESASNKPEMITEVNRHRRQNSDIKKVIKAIRELGSLKVVFVFNIAASECRRTSKPDFDEADGNCFSGVRRYDVIQLVTRVAAHLPIIPAGCTTAHLLCHGTSPSFPDLRQSRPIHFENGKCYSAQ